MLESLWESPNIGPTSVPCCYDNTNQCDCLPEGHDRRAASKYSKSARTRVCKQSHVRQCCDVTDVAGGGRSVVRRIGSI